MHYTTILLTLLVAGQSDEISLSSECALLCRGFDILHRQLISLPLQMIVLDHKNSVLKGITVVDSTLLKLGCVYSLGVATWGVYKPIKGCKLQVLGVKLFEGSI